MISLDDFKNKAMAILKEQRFADFPLFDSEDIDDFEIGDDVGSMDLELFLNEFYDAISFTNER